MQAGNSRSVELSCRFSNLVHFLLHASTHIFDISEAPVIPSADPPSLPALAETLREWRTSSEASQTDMIRVSDMSTQTRSEDTQRARTRDAATQVIGPHDAERIARNWAANRGQYLGDAKVLRKEFWHHVMSCLKRPAGFNWC